MFWSNNYTCRRWILVFHHFFTKYCSCYGYVYFIKCKSDSFEKCKEFKVEVEHKKVRVIKEMRSYYGREYLSGEFKDFLVHQGIVSQLTISGHPCRIV